MATAEVIVKAAIRKIGERNPTNAELADGLEKLNDLLSSLSAEKLMTHVNTRETHTLTASTAEYTWGSGGDITTTRPIKIFNVFLRDSSGNDYPVNVITEEVYDERSLKTTEGRPDRLYFATEYPLAKIFLYPTPNAAETLHFSTWKALSELSGISSSVSLPNEYKLPLANMLLLELAGDYGYEPSPNDHRNAETSKDRLRQVNMKNMITQFPREITKYKALNIDNLRFI